MPAGPVAQMNPVFPHDTGGDLDNLAPDNDLFLVQLCPVLVQFGDGVGVFPGGLLDLDLYIGRYCAAAARRFAADILLLFSFGWSCQFGKDDLVEGPLEGLAFEAAHNHAGAESLLRADSYFGSSNGKPDLFPVLLAQFHVGIAAAVDGLKNLAGVWLGRFSRWCGDGCIVVG